MVSTGHPPRVVAAVLNWCRERETAACVESLLADGYEPLDILIVDNASPDGSGHRLRDRYPALHFLQTGANLGYAGGNLCATSWALERGYDYVLVINDDAEVRPACIGALVRALESHPAAGAAAPTIVHHGTSSVWFGGGTFVRFKGVGVHASFGEELHGGTAAEHAVEDVSFLTGCVLLLRSEALRAAGSFRAEFFSYVEDLELSLRFNRRGWRLLYVPAAVASHKVAYPAPPDSAFAIRLRDRNRRRLVALHYGGFSRLAFRAWFYPTRLVHLARYLVQGDRARAVSIWQGLSDAI